MHDCLSHAVRFMCPLSVLIATTYVTLIFQVFYSPIGIATTYVTLIFQVFYSPIGIATTYVSISTSTYNFIYISVSLSIIIWSYRPFPSLVVRASLVLVTTMAVSPTAHALTPTSQKSPSKTSPFLVATTPTNQMPEMSLNPPIKTQQTQ